MSETRAELLSRMLWPAAGHGNSVWAVLDCARSPAVYRALLESRLEFLCLYSGKLARELELAAPHIVELLPGHRFTTRLLTEAWGDSWGVFVKIDDPSNLRHHLRKFLKVKNEAGGTLLFRYYDPRVLRVFLPTCTPAELQQFFGPLDAMYAESGSGDALIEFTQRGGKLQQRRLAAVQEHA